MIMLHFVKAIHVELPDETINFFMSKVARKYDFFELHDVSDYELQP